MIGSTWPAGTSIDGPTETEIILWQGPIHTDFLIPLTPQVRDHFQDLTEFGLRLDHPFATYLIVGWGGRAFYTTVGDYTDVNAHAIWRGVIGDDSVLRFDVGIGHVLEQPDLKRVPLTKEQVTKLLAQIRAEMVPGPPVLQSGFRPGDVFMPARSRFHIFRTCNVWAGQVLRKSGVRFGIWTPLRQSVSLSHWMYGKN